MWYVLQVLQPCSCLEGVLNGGFVGGGVVIGAAGSRGPGVVMNPLPLAAPLPPPRPPPLAPFFLGFTILDSVVEVSASAVFAAAIYSCKSSSG